MALGWRQAAPGSRQVNGGLRAGCIIGSCTVPCGSAPSSRFGASGLARRSLKRRGFTPALYTAATARTPPKRQRSSTPATWGTWRMDRNRPRQPTNRITILRAAPALACVAVQQPSPRPLPRSSWPTRSWSTLRRCGTQMLRARSSSGRIRSPSRTVLPRRSSPSSHRAGEYGRE